MGAEGRHSLRYEFEPTAAPELAAGKVTPGHAKPFIDGEVLGEADF